jgi:hypothetical protein
MRTQRFVRPLPACLAILLLVGIHLVAAGRNAGVEPGTHSALTDVTTGEHKGFVVIAPDARDREGEFHAEVTVTVHDVEPNTTYQVWRAIDFVPDGTYDPTAPGLEWEEIATITTSSGGAGTAHFIRGGGLFSGDQFDVLLQVRLDDGVTPELKSDVMTVTVK